MISFSQPISATKIMATLACAMLCPLTISARVRTADEAQKVAENYLKTSLQDASLTPATNPATRGEADNYFVFNVGKDNGYIIVAADDKFQEVLGYADSGNYASALSNPSFVFWMNNLSEEMAKASANPAGAPYPAGNANVVAATNPLENAQLSKDAWKAPVTRAVNAIDVEPLLKTKWGQGAPYNNECWETGSLRPTIGWTPGHAPTGCVATAMAQVMKYHAWPQAYGEGADAYEYKWDLMADSYDGSESEEAIDQVAKLMKHIGTSVNMQYYASESSASPFAIPNALVGKFGYDDATIQKLWRDSYGYVELHNILYKELAEGRPVIVGGDYPDSDMGHQFVLDGCTSDDFFHINWGWNGYCDGYFRLTSLRPADYGTGGSQQGYSFNVDFTIGIQPKRNIDPNELRAVITPLGDLCLNFDQDSEEIFYSRTETYINISTINGTYAGFMNTGCGDFYGEYRGDKINFVTRVDNLTTGEFVNYVEHDVYHETLHPGYYTSYFRINNPARKDIEMEDGNQYKVTLYYKYADSEDYIPVKFAPGRRSYFIMETADDGKIKFTFPSSTSALTASLPADFTRLQRRNPQTIDLSLSNPGDEEYLGAVKCRFTDANGNICKSLTDYVMVDLLPGQSTTETLTIYNVASVQPGTYTLGLYDFRNRLISEPREIELYDYTLTIDETNFPDPAFREYVASNLDADHNGALNDAELAEVRTISLQDLSITDLTGIGNFYNLYGITLNNLPLTSLNLTECSALAWATIGNCPLESVNFEGLPEFYYIQLLNTNITDLDLSRYTNLEEILVYDNQIETLILPQGSKLRRVSCRNNKLTELDVAGCPNLSSLEVGQNAIKTLDISGLTNLTYLSCYNNQLESLDISRLDKLTQFYASGNGLTDFKLGSHPELISLSLYENKLEGKLDVTGCPALQSLDLEDNSFSELNLPALPDLGYLYLTNNSLEGTLDLSNSDKLVRLCVSVNAFTELLLGSTANLQYLTVNTNQLSGILDLSEAEKLKEVYAYGNSLQGIVFGNHPELTNLNISGNEIEGTLDISGMPNLTEMRAYDNHISTFKYGNHPALRRLLVERNALTHIHADDFPVLSSFACYGQQAALSISTPNFNAKTLASTGFDVNRASDWWAEWEENGERRYHECEVISGVVMIPEEAGRDVVLIYSYLTDAANNKKTNFNLQLTREGFNSIDDLIAEGIFSISGNRVVFADGIAGEIYTPAGICVYNGYGESDALPKGIYIVRVGSSIMKISLP